MNLYIEGYRSHNKDLVRDLTDASYYYAFCLLGNRMVNSDNLIVDIQLVKDMKQKAGAYGFCSITGSLTQPREFQIDLDTGMEHDRENILTWLAHEFVHLKQFLRKELWDYDDNTTQWKTKRYKLNTITYDDAPWEKEAYRLESKLYKAYMEQYYE